MDSWGDRVPLPDANKRSPRVYTNLQNIDLSTVTFANVEATGDPIQIEDINEDELRRIVLVNLARMCVAGEWTGLLEAGGGGGFSYGSVNVVHSTYKYQAVAMMFVNGGGESVANESILATSVHYPFVATGSGDITSATIYVSGATAGGNTLVGIYSDVDGWPGSLLGFATIDSSAVASVTQTSFSSTVTTVAGTQYWIGYCRDVAGAVTCYAIGDGGGAQYLSTQSVDTAKNFCVRYDGASDYSLPASPDVGDLIVTSERKIKINLGWV